MNYTRFSDEQPILSNKESYKMEPNEAFEIIMEYRRFKGNWTWDKKLIQDFNEFHNIIKHCDPNYHDSIPSWQKEIHFAAWHWVIRERYGNWNEKKVIIRIRDAVKDDLLLNRKQMLKKLINDALPLIVDSDYFVSDSDYASFRVPFKYDDVA